jgi:hypothetical protein
MRRTQAGSWEAARSGRTLWVGVIGGLAVLAGPGSAAGNGLEAGFRNPPAAARPHTWWHWMNGNASREGITADLEAMKRVGIGGAQIFNVDVGLPAGPAPFMSTKWRELMGHAVREAERLGLELCIHNCAGWSSSGGPWIRPEHAMQVLVWTETPVRGPGPVEQSLRQPLTRVGFYRDVAVLAFKTPPAGAGEAARLSQINGKAAFERVDGLQPVAAAPGSSTAAGAAIARAGTINLTDRMDRAGRLTWDAPAGEWTVLRLGHTPTGKDNHPAPPEGRGLECDKLSREAMDAHWAGMMATVLKEAGPLVGRALNNALIDSYEVGSQNWTPRFREEFRRRRGYDPLPYLPAVTGHVVEGVEASERFLWDFRRTIADLYADNYFGYFGELCRRHGMRFSVEPYGNGTFDNLQVGGLADIPMGEFWVGGAAAETVKLAASAAHTHGRAVVGAESFTADEQQGRWLVDPYSIKALGDRMFCEGVNRYIFHRYAHQPWQGLLPGMTMGPWGMHLERTVTWWSQGSAWLRYVARCQQLLQAGRFAADVCYFAGEGAPLDLPGRSGLRPEMPAGYDYDGCDATVLDRMTVRNGRIALPGGMQYRVLVLPESRLMTPAVLRKVRDLVSGGATVVGPRPEKSPSLSGYPGCDEEVRRIAGEVWGDCDGRRVTARAYGKGRVVWGRPLVQVLTQMGVGPDFAAVAEGGRDLAPPRLATIHRTAGDAEIYFVSNQRYQSAVVLGSFRVAGKAPELWRPDTGRMELAPVYREQGGRTMVPLQLEPAGSMFVVFRRRPAAREHWVSMGREGKTVRRAAPRLEVRRAFYEAADGRGADVTAKVAALVAAGETVIPATNAVFGDPVPNVVKRLRVDYRLNGKPMQRTVGENEVLELATEREDGALPSFEVTATPGGAVALTPWQAGVYAGRTAAGRTVRFRVREGARRLSLAGPWALRFPPGWGAPPQVRLGRLTSWSERPEAGARYFSGTAEYRQSFTVPAAMVRSGQRVVLDLGRVKNLAEVRLNGRDLGVLWKAPFRLDVTGRVKAGRNSLSVRVTNLWPNRLIGDAQLPEEVEWQGNAIAAWPRWLVEGRPRPKTGRFTFTTWRFYRKDSPLLESGLLGPVAVWSAKTLIIR